MTAVEKINNATFALPTFKNAAKLLASVKEDKPYLKYVQVKDKTANFADGCMLLRRHCSAPDGLYTVTMDGSIKPSSAPPEYFFKFPNFDVVRPPFETMKPFCEIPQRTRGEIIKLCEAVKQRDGTVVIDGDSMWMRQDLKTGISFPFNMPHAVSVDPRYLQIAVIEMLQYPVVYFLREIRKDVDGGIETPLVFGCDWGSCSVIMPRKDTHYG